MGGVRQSAYIVGAGVHVKRRRLSAGEVRFRISRIDQERIEWLIKNHPDQHATVSALLRALIAREHAALTHLAAGMLGAKSRRIAKE